MMDFNAFINGCESKLMAMHEWCALHLTDLFHNKYTYIFIGVVSLLTLFFGFISEMGDKPRKTGVWGKVIEVVYVLFPIAMIMVVLSLLTCGFDGAVWWCNPNEIGFWKTVLYVGVYALFLGVVLTSIGYYIFSMPKQLADHGGLEKAVWLSVFHLFGSILLLFPLYPILFWLHLPGIVSICLFVLPLLAGLAKTIENNMGNFGTKYGLLFTLASIAICVGFIAALCYLFIAIWELFKYFVITAPLVFVAIVLFAWSCRSTVVVVESLGGGWFKVVDVFTENISCGVIAFFAVVALILAYFFGFR